MWDHALWYDARKNGKGRPEIPNAEDTGQERRRGCALLQSDESEKEGVRAHRQERQANEEKEGRRRRRQRGGRDHVH